MLSPYRFYQFWFNRPDVEMEGLLKRSRSCQRPRSNDSPKNRAPIPAHAKPAHPRMGSDQLRAWRGRDAGGDRRVRSPVRARRRPCSIDEDTLEAAIDGLKIEDESGAKTFASVGIDDRITEAGVKAGLFKSISEARKTIKSGGVYLNNNRVTDEEQTLGQDDFLHGRFALIRRGKKALGVVEKH